MMWNTIGIVLVSAHGMIMGGSSPRLIGAVTVTCAVLPEMTIMAGAIKTAEAATSIVSIKETEAIGPEAMT